MIYFILQSCLLQNFGCLVVKLLDLGKVKELRLESLIEKSHFINTLFDFYHL